MSAIDNVLPRSIESTREKTFYGLPEYGRDDYREFREARAADERMAFVVREEWRESDLDRELDLEANADSELTVYVRPSAIDVAALLERLSIDSVEHANNEARYYTSVDTYYGTTVRNHVAVPEARAERFHVELTGWSPERLRVIESAAGIKT